MRRPRPTSAAGGMSTNGHGGLSHDLAALLAGRPMFNSALGISYPKHTDCA